LEFYRAPGQVGNMNLIMEIVQLGSHFTLDNRVSLPAIDVNASTSQ
jgi:hypothetical protein